MLVLEFLMFYSERDACVVPVRELYPIPFRVRAWFFTMILSSSLCPKLKKLSSVLLEARWMVGLGVMEANSE